MLPGRAADPRVRRLRERQLLRQDIGELGRFYIKYQLHNIKSSNGNLTDYDCFFKGESGRGVRGQWFEGHGGVRMERRVGQRRRGEVFSGFKKLNAQRSNIDLKDICHIN